VAKKLKVYLIGSLRNPAVPEMAQELRKLGLDVFDDWYAAGPEADDKWRDYEKGRGHTFRKGLKGFAADHVYKFDLKHLNDCDVAVLILPAGKSGHLELGYCIGRGKKGYILTNDPERWDVMYLFAQDVFDNFTDLRRELLKVKRHAAARKAQPKKKAKRQPRKKQTKKRVCKVRRTTA
jgi:nucleoside 2-deoxyribosyltransferase